MNEKIKALLVNPVRIHNDEERDKILEIYQKEGITTRSHISGIMPYPYSLSYVYSLDRQKYEIIYFDRAFGTDFNNFIKQYNALASEKCGFLVKEKIKNLKAGVVITNDRERDEFLSICQEAGVRWRNMEDAIDYEPKDDYPYVIYSSPVEAIYDDDATLMWCPPDEVNYSTISFDEFKTRLNNHQYEIIISCYDGKTTTARMMVDGKEVRSSETKRLENDKFNWRIGAELAAERLWDKKPKVEVKIFNIGDKVRVGGKSSPSHLRGKTGIVKKFSCGNVNSIGVEFDDPDFQGHNLNGTIESTRGWWVGRAYLRKVK